MTADAQRARQFEIDRARHLVALVRRLPDEIEKVTWPLPRLWALRDLRLRRLLAHANAFSPWHAHRLRHVDVNSITGADLRRIPPMTKADLMANWDAIVTDRRLTLERVVAHLEHVVAHGLEYLLGEYVAVTTSGSSGQRAIILRDFDGLLEAALANIRNGYWWRRRRPDLAATVDRQARLLADTPVHISTVIGRVFERAERRSLTLPPSVPAVDALAALAEFSPNRLIGYPSALRRLIEAATPDRPLPSVWDVACNAEPLTPATRHAIESAFGIPLRNLYGTSETGTIAESHPPNRELQLLEDVVVFEPVSAGGEAVDPGATSSSVLVTNVVNLVLPLIRYEIEDRVAILPVPPPGPATGRLLGDIEGRSSDTFRYPGGVAVEAAVFRTILASELSVVEYQVRQEPAGATIMVVLSAPLDTENLRRRLEGQLRSCGLRQPLVQIRAVQTIAPGGGMQKLDRFVPTRS